MTDRVSLFTALCRHYHLESMAPVLIESGLSIDDAKRVMATLAALLDTDAVTGGRWPAMTWLEELRLPPAVYAAARGAIADRVLAHPFTRTQS